MHGPKRQLLLSVSSRLSSLLVCTFLGRWRCPCPTLPPLFKLSLLRSSTTTVPSPPGAVQESSGALSSGGGDIEKGRRLQELLTKEEEGTPNEGERAELEEIGALQSAIVAARGKG